MGKDVLPVQRRKDIEINKQHVCKLSTWFTFPRTHCAEFEKCVPLHTHTFLLLHVLFWNRLASTSLSTRERPWALDPPASVSLVMVLQVCSTTPGPPGHWGLNPGHLRAEVECYRRTLENKRLHFRKVGMNSNDWSPGSEAMAVKLGASRNDKAQA